jgi:hypothetical protein
LADRYAEVFDTVEASATFYRRRSCGFVADAVAKRRREGARASKALEDQPDDEHDDDDQDDDPGEDDRRGEGQ